jgi:UDP-N-acetylmuramoylalanine--D-glutamate ligase
MTLGHLDGVPLIDNGVSTVPASTLAAMAALPGPLRWVGGGRSKGCDLDQFAAALDGRVASAHLFGEIAVELAAAIARRAPLLSVSVDTGVEAALAAAYAAARFGDQVLFSPAFSSYDQYRNFRERAERVGAWFRRQPRTNPTPRLEKPADRRTIRLPECGA